MLHPLRSLLGGFAGLAHSRLALLGSELREEGVRARSVLIGAFAAIILGGLGLAFAGGALVFAVEESHRLAAASGVALAFLGASFAAGWYVQRLLATTPGVFSGSLGELERDREALVAESHSERASVIEGGAELARLVSIGVLAYTIARRLRGK